MKHTKSAFTAIVAFLLLLSQNGFSGNGVPALLPFQGRATDANGNPINYPVEVRFRIYPPSGNCYLYEEVQNVTPNSYGIFSVILGTGVTQPPLNSLSDVFNNDASTAMNDSCSQPYNSAVNDWRRLEMVVDGVSLGMQTIGSSAFALNAQLLQGKSPSDFILKSSNVTQANLENLVGGGDASGLHNHDGRYIRVDGSNSFSGNVSTSGNIIASSTTGMVGIGTTSPVADIHITKTSPVVRLEATPGAAGLPALDFYSGTNRRAKIEVSEATNGIKFYSGNSQAMEIDSSGNLLLNASLKITGTTGLGKYTTSQESALIVALGALGSVATGTLWVNSTNNTLRFWDGSQALTVMSGNSVAITPDQITNAAGKYFSYKPNGVACSDQQILTWDNTNSRWICGAVAVNKAGDTMTGPLVLSADPLVNLGAATKQYVDTKLLSQAAPAAPGVGQNGQALRWNNGSSTWEYYTPNSGAVTSVGASAPLSSSGGATPSISISQATTSTDGYLSSTDWNSFNNKLGTLSSFGGDVSGNYNSTSVDKIKGVAVTPGAYAAGQALRYDGTQWVNTILNFADLGGKPTSLSGYGITDAVNKTGDTMTGLLVLSADPSANLGAATKQYVDSALSSSGSNFIRKDGTVAFTGNQSMGANRLTNVSDPTSAQDAATKNYSDTKLLSQTAPAAPGVGQNGQALRWNNGLSTWEYFTPNSGSVTSVGASAPLSSSGGATPSISISQATTSTDGYLSSTDWNTFNNKLGTSSSFSGDVSGNYNSTSVDKIKGKAITPGSYASGQTLRYDGTQWVNATLDFADLSNKPTTLSGYGITDSLSTTLANGKILVGNGSNVATAVTVSGDASISNAGVLSLSTTGVSAGTYSKVTVDTSGRVTAGANIASSDVTTALGYTPLNKAGDSMSGTLGLVQLASDPNTAGWNGTQKGYTWFNTTSNQVKYWDGSSIQALGISGAGLTSLNGQTGSTQTFASPGTSGTAPSWSSAGNSHTLNIPMANTASVTAGLISKTEYDTFNTKLGTSTSFSGDVSGNYNSTSVDKIKGKAVTPSAYVSGQTLRFDGTQWINATLDFTDLSNRPTTLSGYGITDSVNKTGDTMTGLLVLSADPSANLGAATKQYVDSALSSSGSNFIRKDGTVAFTGNQSMGANRLTNVSDPTSAQDAATKNYADTKLLSQAAPTAPGVGQNGQALRWNNGLSAWEYFTPNSGAVTSVSASAPLSSSGGTTPSISISQATTATNGYLSSTDWNTFNNKLGTSSSFSGDVSGNFNSTSVDKIKGIAVTPGAYASGQTLRYDGTQWVNAVLNFADLGSKPTTLSGYGITDGLSNTLANGKVLIGNGSNIATAVTVTGDASISNAGVLNLSSTGVGAGTYSKVTVDITGRVTTATNIASGDVTTALGYTPLNKAGDSMSGTLGLVQLASDPNTTGWNGTQKGYTWFNTTSNQVKYWDGSAIQALGISGAGLTSLNGQTGSTQTFASPGTSGTAPSWSSAGNSHTLNIPMANTASVTAGLISKTEYDTFNTKLGTSTSFSGDVSGNYNSTSVDKIKGVAVTPGAYAAGQTLRYDGTQWINAVLSFADLGSKPTTLSGYGITDAVNKTGDTMTGLLVLSADPSANLGAATKQYVDSALSSSGSNFIRKDGTVAFTGNQSMGANRLTSVADPTSAQDAATKNYADTKLLSQTAPAAPGVGQNGQALRWNNGLSTWEYFSPSAGTVTSITTGTGLSGGPISGSGTINLANTAVTAASYGSATAVASFTVDAQGRLTAASNTNIALPPSQITQSGASSGNVLTWNGSAWTPAAVAPAGSNGQIQFNNSGSLGASANLNWDNTNSRLGIGTASPATQLEIAGALRLSSTTTDSFVTPKNSSIPTKINIPVYDPGNYGQILAMGLPSTAQTTARAITMLDARTTVHQPTLAVLSPDENKLLGLSFDGSNSTGYLKTTSTDLGLIVNNTMEAIHILSSGYVGIGTTAPSTALEVVGTVKATALLLTSDRRAKSNIVSLTSAESLEKICRVRPVSFNWKAGGSPDQGVIAQELQQIFPDMVVADENGRLAVRYSSLISPMISSIQELNKQNRKLASENQNLQNRVVNLEQENDDIKKQLAEIKSALKELNKKR